MNDMAAFELVDRCYPSFQAALATKPNAELVRAELQRILSSSSFNASERNRRFLTYVVEETLEGRGDRIKAYNIATSVFGRDKNFDPQLDPVVRMEARRVRRAIECFYAMDGQRTALCISMPTGGYVPIFHVPDTGRLGRPLQVVVSAFEMEANAGGLTVGQGLARQIVVRLNRSPEVSVFASRSLSGDFSHPALVTVASDLDLVLSGSVLVSSDEWDAAILCADARSGKVVWAESFQCHVTCATLYDDRDRLAQSVVRSLLHELPSFYDNVRL